LVAHAGDVAAVDAESVDAPGLFFDFLHDGAEGLVDGTFDFGVEHASLSHWY